MNASSKILRKSFKAYVSGGVSYSVKQCCTSTNPSIPFCSIANGNERSIAIRTYQGLFTTVKATHSLTSTIQSHRLLSNWKRTDWGESGELYIRCLGTRCRWCSRECISKPWFGFDLDDTLHEYRKASKVATAAVLDCIHNKYGISIDDLKSAYSEILKTSTSTAFTDGRPSDSYRKNDLLLCCITFHCLTNQNPAQKCWASSPIPTSWR